VGSNPISSTKISVYAVIPLFPLNPLLKEPFANYLPTFRNRGVLPLPFCQLQRQKEGDTGLSVKSRLISQMGSNCSSRRGRLAGYRWRISRLVVHDLKEQECMYRVGSFRAGRCNPNLRTSLNLGHFVVNLSFQASHCRRTGRIRIVNQHGSVEVSI